MSMHNAIGAEMLQGKQGKSRFHMYMHVVCLILSWYVHKVDASFFIHDMNFLLPHWCLLLCCHVWVAALPWDVWQGVHMLDEC